MIDTLAGRYRLVEQLATGGMGTVWRAHDEVLERDVAVKVLNESLAGDAAASERFRREALTAASIAHPHMANVYDYIEDENGRPSIVMELVEGETLAHRLAREKRLPIGDAVSIACDILMALEAAHSAGIVHRDIKPANILLTEDTGAKVTDFGIARSLGDASLTATGTVMGTAHYSAPEQVRGERATPATDVYATGVVLYEMLCGVRAFEADTPIAVAMLRLEADPEPVRTHRSSVSDPLQSAVMRALAREPADRFASAAAMEAALQTAIEHVEPPTPLTAIMPAASADTIAMPAAATPEPAEKHEGLLSDVITPRWAGKRLLMFMLPLFVVTLIAMLVAASMGSSKPAAPAPVQSATPTPTPSVAAVSCCTVPALTGLTLTEAIRALTAAGLDLRSLSYQQTSDFAENSVISQRPDAGTMLGRNGSVFVVVAISPQGGGRKHHKHKNDHGG